MGRVYCCHRSTEEGTALWFYVPPDVTVNVGGRCDSPEWAASQPRQIRVLSTWQPKSARSKGLPIRSVHGIHQTTHCGGGCSTGTPDAAEGWALKKGFWNTWFKPASDAQSQ